MFKIVGIPINRHAINVILKRSRDCLLYTKKETNCGLFIVNTLHYFYLTWKLLTKILSEPKVSKSLYILDVVDFIKTWFA